MHLMQMMQPVYLHFWQQWATSLELAELQLYNNCGGITSMLPSTLCTMQVAHVLFVSW